MKKVKVVTLHRVFNYGSVLQAYATQKAVESVGAECEIVDYITEQRTKRALKKKYEIHGLRGLVYYLLRCVSIGIKWRTFDRFIKKNIAVTSRQYISTDDLRKSPPLADIYMTGSDQVWNSKYNEGIDHGFFLDFGDEETRRVAFAASIGQDKLEEREKPEIARLLSKYAIVSVREKSAVDIVRDLTGREPTLIIDPTLQLDASEWTKLESKPLMKKRYVLLMLLYNEDNGATDYARKVADRLGCELVKISWDLTKDRRIDRLFTHRSPVVFLSLMHHAEYVVTNSFHGTAFCLNYNKRFSVIKRNEMQTRIDSILQLTGLTSRLVEPGAGTAELSEVDAEIDYDRVNAVLSEERTKAKDFLREAVYG